MTEAEFRVWTLQAKLLNDLLSRVEHAEHAILTEMGCPRDPVAIFAILQGERVAPWRKRTAVRDRQRAAHAMNTLALIASVRGHLALGKENAQQAAHAALLAGLHANDAAANAVLTIHTRTNQKTKGRKRGEDIARDATQHDPVIKKHYRRWNMGDELQDEYRSAATYIKKNQATAPHN